MSPKTGAAKKIQASVFKAKCLEILDQVPVEGIVITKHGEPVAKLIPMPNEGSVMDFYGSMKDEIKINGDILSTGERWEAGS